MSLPEQERWPDLASRLARRCDVLAGYAEEDLQRVESMLGWLQANPRSDRQGDLFRIELEELVDANHAMVKLAGRVDWARLEETFVALYSPETGAPGHSTRLMIALHCLKFSSDLSNEDIVAGWIENPCWQYLSGMKFFGHRRPVDPSSMTNWRKRVGEAGAEAMLKETIQAGVALRDAFFHPCRKGSCGRFQRRGRRRWPS